MLFLGGRAERESRFVGSARKKIKFGREREADLLFKGGLLFQPEFLV